MLETLSVYIIIDDREKHSGVVNCLQRIKDVKCEIKRLDVGDYILNRKIVVERKTLPDFAVSIKDGRLFKQAGKLIALHLQPVFILEGKNNRPGFIKMRREAMQGALITLNVLFNIPVLRSQNPDETARLLVYTARQLLRMQRKPLFPKYRKFGKRRGPQLMMLQSIPGIGVKKAQSLLSSFANIQNIANAECKSLAGVKGIGSRSAEIIFASFR